MKVPQAPRPPEGCLFLPSSKHSTLSKRLSSLYHYLPVCLHELLKCSCAADSSLPHRPYTCYSQLNLLSQQTVIWLLWGQPSSFPFKCGLYEEEIGSY